MSSTTSIIFSEDGSHTIHSEKFGVSYHSRHGAIQETDTVFIQSGLRYQVEQGLQNIRILEMGFGTGLNALMTLMSEFASSVNLDYHTIEAYPIDLETAAALNYSELLSADEATSNMFLEMHRSKSGQKRALKDNFTFTKHIVKLEEFISDEQFDIIYYDAFAPNAQEHLWTPETMQELAKLSNKGCALVTYCAKGSFKRALRSADFKVEGLPGPIGKREMTRGIYLG